MGEKYFVFSSILTLLVVVVLIPYHISRGATLCKFTPVYIISDCPQVKRRRRVNGEVSKIFHHVKTHKEQPGRQLFCLPSGLGTFTCFALRSALLKAEIANL